jgi:hypothetical protein
MIDLADLRDKIAVSLAAEGCDAAVLFGRAELTRRDNQGPGSANRVVVAPGNPDSLEWGTLSVGRKSHTRAYPGEADHGEIVTVDVWAYDSSAPADEVAQYRALRVLWNRVVRAIGTALRGGSVPGEGAHTHTFWGATPRLYAQPADRRHGERCRVIFTIDFDVRAVAPPLDVVGAEAAPPAQGLEE